MNEPTTHWVEVVVVFVVGWLMTWGTWVSRKALDALPKEDFEKHRDARNLEMTALVAKIATKEDISELRKEIADMRNLLIKDLRER